MFQLGSCKHNIIIANNFEYPILRICSVSIVATWADISPGWQRAYFLKNSEENIEEDIVAVQLFAGHYTSPISLAPERAEQPERGLSHKRGWAGRVSVVQHF